jgi:hypothetical protein
VLRSMDMTHAEFSATKKSARDVIVRSDEHLVALAWSLACIQLTLNIRIWASAAGKIKDDGLS